MLAVGVVYAGGLLCSALLRPTKKMLKLEVEGIVIFKKSWLSVRNYQGYNERNSIPPDDAASHRVSHSPTPGQGC